jgi:hypothetical protein
MSVSAYMEGYLDVMQTKWFGQSENYNSYSQCVLLPCRVVVVSTDNGRL